MTGPERLPDPEELLARLTGVLTQGTLEEAMTEAAQWLGELTRARMATLLLFERDEVVGEFPYGATDGDGADVAIHLKDVAQESARRGAPVSAPWSSGAVVGAHVRAWPLGEKSRVHGVLALALPRRDDERDPAAERFVTGVVPLLARRVAADRELARSTAASAQYDHWFRMLDKQLRVLERERQKFSAVVNQSDLVVFVTDLQCTIRWANRTLGRRVPPAEGEASWIGRPCGELAARLCGHSATELAPDPVARAIETGETVHAERQAEGPNGVRNLYVTALPIKGADGIVQEIMVLVQDITDLEVVRQAEERLRTVVSNSPIVLFSIDRNGTFTLSEGRGLEALGLASGEVVGQSAYEVYRDEPQILANLSRALRGEEFTDVVTIGSLRFETRYRPIVGSNGQIDGLIGVGTDITERQRLEDDMRRSQKLEAVARLAGGVAHDFNNLLTSVMGQAHLLALRLGPEDRLQECIRDIYAAGARGAELTRQLAAFAKRGTPNVQVLNLNRVIAEFEGLLRRMLGEDVDLLTSPAEDAAWVRAERQQIEQALVHLAANARDAMPTGGRLRITAENGPSGAMLTIEDSGTGMDAEIRRRLFEPFFTTKDKAAGLGLSVVYGLVRQWEAEIEVESEPGEGTKVSLRFPRVEAGAAPPVPDDALSDQGVPDLLGAVEHRGDETVLLVEDEAGVRGPIHEALSVSGYTVLVARDGLHALELVDHHPGAIDLIVTDVIMPNMGGGELVRRLRTERPDLRVLYISGFNDDAGVRNGVLGDGDAFMQKPFGLGALTRRVRQILDTPRSTSASDPRVA